MANEVIPKSSFHKVIVTHFVLLCIFSVFYCGYIGFELAKWAVLGAVVVSCLLIFGLLKLVKWIVDKDHKKRKVGILEKTENEMLWGFGGVVMSTIVPRVMVYFIGDSWALFTYFTLVFLITSILIHFVFTRNYNQYCELDGDASSSIFVYILNLAALAFSMRAVTFVPRTNTHGGFIVATQIIFFILGLVSSMEYSFVSNGCLVLRENKKPRDSKIQTLTECVFPGYELLALVLTVIFSGLAVGFGHGTCLILISAVIAVIGLFLVFVLKIVTWLLGKMKVSKKNQARTVMLLGFGGMMISSIVPRIFVFYAREKLLPLFACIWICLATAILFYTGFIAPNRAYWTLNFSERRKAVGTVILLNGASLFLIIDAATAYRTTKEVETIIYTQIGLAAISMTTMVDFVVALLGGVEQKKGVDVPLNDVKIEKPPKPQKQKNGQPKVQRDSHECKICTNKFNDTTRIPRILKECGHTVCEPCANKLLIFLSLICPFCTKRTAVGGKANMLPKNFGLLEAIEESKL